MPDYLAAGGLLLYPIALCSVIALAIALERWLALRRVNILPLRTTDEVLALAKAGKVEEAVAVCEDNDAAATHIFLATLRVAGRSRTRVKEAAEEAGQAETARMERYVEGLATIATVSPLLGLLGTVLGMIQAFQDAELHGFGNPSAFASGIWQALVTTAAGLCVAIPSFLIYRALLSRIDRFVAELQERAQALADEVAAEDEG